MIDTTRQPLNIESLDDTLRVHIPATLTRQDCCAALEQAQQRLNKSSQAIQIDLQDVTEKDACAVALAVELQHWCRDLGRTVVLGNAPAALTENIRTLQAEGTDQDTSGMSFIGVPEQVGEKAVSFWNSLRLLLEFTGQLCVSLTHAVRHPGKVRWKDVLIYMDRCGAGGLPIVVLICFLMGLILGFQAALQLQTFGADIYVANLVNLSISRELGPLMVAMIATGRAGSAFAAEIGTMKVSEEVDALITMGLEPSRFLVVPKVIALIAVMPLLTICGDAAGIAGGFVVGSFQLDIPLVSYWNQTVTTLVPWDIFQGLIKSVVFALFIAAVGCLRGLQTRGGAQGVGSSTTSAVVSGIFCIIISDAAMTIIFARLGLG